MVPSALWVELRVLGAEVWSRSLEERARRGKPEQERNWVGGRAKAFANKLPSWEKSSLKPILHEPNSASRSTLSTVSAGFCSPKGPWTSKLVTVEVPPVRSQSNTKGENHLFLSLRPQRCQLLGRMAETGGDEARDEQQLSEKQRHLLRARPQEREHNSSLRSGRSCGRRSPQMPGLGLRDPAVLRPFATLTAQKLKRGT